MQTVVLAAGEGTRMRPLTETRPKPMLPVVGRPLLEHVLEAAVTAGATRLIIVIGYEGNSIREHVGDSLNGIPVTYVEQPEQRGTAHALAQAAPELDAAPFVVLNGDGLFDTSSLDTLFDQGPAVGTYVVENPQDYGVLQVADGTVLDIQEKPSDPPSNRVNTGAYVFPASARHALDVAESSRGELEITDVLERVIETDDVTPVEFDRWLDVGRPWELLAANEWKLEELSTRIDGVVADDVTLSGDVVIESGARVKPGVVIEGPVYVGAGTSVGPNAYVRGPTVLDDGAHVGHAVEIKNSVLLPGATVGHLSYVGDSILGAGVNFGAGTTVANLRHDDMPVRLQVKGESVSTGRRKFGVVCGDDVKTGIQTSLNAGVKLSAGTTTHPDALIERDQ